MQLSFEYKGIIEAQTAEGGADISAEKAEEIAIEIDAEEVGLVKDSAQDDKTIYRVGLSSVATF